MKMVVGLGNPGEKYDGTRHNVGFDVVEAVAEAAGIAIAKKSFSSLCAKEKFEGRETLFLLPQTYMNRSGEAVREAMAFYKIAPKDLMVVHDDLDLPLGRLKTDFNSGAAGHKGVGSIIDLIGTKEFHRIRLGIGRPERKEEVEGFVLSPFRDDEEGAKGAMMTAAGQELRLWIVKD
jgi:peptidyl-tRNA hydrolase, PTH1 family